MFLFDKQRTGRNNVDLDISKKPKITWKIKLPTIVNTAPESTPIEDNEGNLFFGTHNGMIYCAHPDSGIKWSWYTGPKVYSSPVWIDEKMFSICSGSGFLLAFTKSGKLEWSYDMCSKYNNLNRRKKILLYLLHLPLIFDWSIKTPHTLKCWASPNLHDNTIYSVAYGEGLHAVDSNTGRAKWIFDLGFPLYHKSGVAISNDGNIYIASNRYAYCINKEGKLIWKSKIFSLFYEVWSNPSIDEENEQVYIIWSKGESSSIVKALDIYTGDIKWSVNFKTGIRGTATIGRGGYLYIPTLDGVLYAIHKINGEVVYKNKIASTSRGLWTSACIVNDDFILLTTKDSNTQGKLICLDNTLREVWSIKTAKSLSVPIVNKKGDIVIGTWDRCLIGFH